MKKIHLLLLAFLVWGCSNIEDKIAHEVGEMAAETLIGENVEIENVANQNKNKATADLLFDGKPLMSATTEMAGTVVIVGDAMVTLSLSNDDEHFLIGFTVDEADKTMLQQHPIQGTALLEDKKGIGFSLTFARQEGAGLSFVRGQATIDQLTDEKVVLTINGKATDLLNVTKEETFKSLTGTLTLEYPTLMFRGSDKSKYIY